MRTHPLSCSVLTAADTKVTSSTTETADKPTSTTEAATTESPNQDTNPNNHAWARALDEDTLKPASSHDGVVNFTGVPVYL